MPLSTQFRGPWLKCDDPDCFARTKKAVCHRARAPIVTNFANIPILFQLNFQTYLLTHYGEREKERDRKRERERERKRERERG